MAYVKHGTGPNDWKKGNRTKGKDRKNKKGNPHPENQEALAAHSAAMAEETNRYKKIAEERAKRIIYGQEYAATLWDNLNEYITERQKQRRPLTIAGMIRASGVGENTYKRYRSGDADHLLFEYMDNHNIDYDMEGQQITDQEGEKVLLLRLSLIIKNAELAIQDQLEENCYTNKGNPAGSIFGLKAKYDWQDTPPDQRTTNNNTLVLNNVASLEEAKDAMKRLNG